MSVIAQNAVGVHEVRVLTPGGQSHEVEVCGLRRALRIANCLAGWLAVDDWESASALMPLGVREVIRELRDAFPDIDPTACIVSVVHPAEGPDAVNGYEAVATYRPGAVVPQVVQNIRAEAKEAGWREHPPERVQAPHLGPVTIDDDDDDEHEDTVTAPREVNYTASEDDPLDPTA